MLVAEIIYLGLESLSNFHSRLIGSKDEDLPRLEASSMDLPLFLVLVLPLVSLDLSEPFLSTSPPFLCLLPPESTPSRCLLDLGAIFSSLEKMESIRKLRISEKNLSVPTLEEMSIVIRSEILKSILPFSELYVAVLWKHLTTETEVQIVDGILTCESDNKMCLLETEWDALQYRSRLFFILGPWINKLHGQPVTQAVGIYIDGLIGSIIKDFEFFISQIQISAQTKMRQTNNALCKKVCKGSFRILNMTSKTISEELESFLSNGINFVPSIELPVDDIRDIVENDLGKAAINVFRDKNGFYPSFTEGLGLMSLIQHLMSQAPTNSCQIEFFYQHV